MWTSIHSRSHNTHLNWCLISARKHWLWFSHPTMLRNTWRWFCTASMQWCTGWPQLVPASTSGPASQSSRTQARFLLESKHLLIQSFKGCCSLPRPGPQWLLDNYTTQRAFYFVLFLLISIKKAKRFVLWHIYSKRRTSRSVDSPKQNFSLVLSQLQRSVLFLQATKILKQWTKLYWKYTLSLLYYMP